MRSAATKALVGATAVIGIAAGTLAGTAATASAAPAAPATAQAEDVGTLGWYCGYHDGTKYADRGDRGNHVKEIQCLLRDVHNISIGNSGIDGDFGPATEKAVKTFQGRKGLAKDGIVGPRTWAKLRG